VAPAPWAAVAREPGAAGGLVGPPAPSSERRGRPPMRLETDPAAGVLLAARLEPGVVRVLAATLDGTPLRKWQGPAGDDPDAAVAGLGRGVDALLAEHGTGSPAVKAAGVGIPALVARGRHLAIGPTTVFQQQP